MRQSFEDALNRATVPWKRAVLQEMWDPVVALLHEGSIEQVLVVRGYQNLKPRWFPVLGLQPRRRYAAGDMRQILSDYYYAWPDKWPRSMLEQGGPRITGHIERRVWVWNRGQLERGKTQLCRFFFGVEEPKCDKGADCPFEHHMRGESPCRFACWRQLSGGRRYCPNLGRTVSLRILAKRSRACGSASCRLSFRKKSILLWAPELVLRRGPVDHEDLE